MKYACSMEKQRTNIQQRNMDDFTEIKKKNLNSSKEAIQKY
jgi:hypothetical protein